MDKCYNIKLGLGIGFEWLYRLTTGPQKIVRLKRLWSAIFVFIFKVLVRK
ncbi:MAG: hypothetical protein Q9M94_00915 [Candidatus Gracilibacteria bacterium]|nr:hypothetical protein [Candidatus Gracilibacteria bacterium]